VERPAKLLEIAQGLPENCLDLIVVRMPVLAKIPDKQALDHDLRIVAAKQRYSEAE